MFEDLFDIQENSCFLLFFDKITEVVLVLNLQYEWRSIEFRFIEIFVLQRISLNDIKILEMIHILKDIEIRYQFGLYG